MNLTATPDPAAADVPAAAAAKKGGRARAC